MRTTTILLGLLAASLAYPQEMTRLVRYDGAMKDSKGTQTLLVSIYKEAEGGVPLWQETVVTELDEQGKYSVILGATKQEGLPVDLFTSGEARWLGIQSVGGRVMEERHPFLSVPYALKAKDAETLNGQPLSSFLTVDHWKEQVSPSGAAALATAASDSSGAAPSIKKATANPQALEGSTGTSYGSGAGTACCNNSFFGVNAGFHTTGGLNSFFGDQAGVSNTSGRHNSFFGTFAGYFNTTGDYNSAMGESAGGYLTTGSQNAFLGYYSGGGTTTGSNNAFVGIR